MAFVVGSRSQRQSVRKTKLGLVFLCSVCLYAARVMPSNMKHQFQVTNIPKTPQVIYFSAAPGKVNLGFLKNLI